MIWRQRVPEDGKKWWASKERDLETAYANCRAVPMTPDEPKIKALLLRAMDIHYGGLGDAVRAQTPTSQLVQELEALVDRFRGAA